MFELDPGLTTRPPVREPIATTAPYAVLAAAADAGRSHECTATRLLAAHQRTGGPLTRWRTPGEVHFLRARAWAARDTARIVEPLRVAGWVVLHDRAVSGTSAVVDHVLIGPAGIAVIQNRPTRTAGIDAAGWPLADGITVHPDRAQTQWAVQQISRATNDRLGNNWHLNGFPILALHVKQPWTPHLSDPASVVTPRQLRWLFNTLPTALAPLHVTDLAMTVEDVCPPAPLTAI